VICLTSLVVMLAVVGVTRAELIGHWTLDETSGTTSADISGREHHGMYINSPGLDIPGVFGTGMDAAGGYMEVDLGTDLPIQAEERTIALWVDIHQEPSNQQFCGYGNTTAGEAFSFTIENVDGEDGIRMRHWGGNMFYPGFITGQWNHLAMRVPAGATIVNDTEVFINGQNIPGYRSSGSDRTLNTAATPFHVGTSIGSQTGEVFDGLLDDVYFYDHALSEVEIRQLMIGTPPGVASEPSPADEATDVPRDVVLSWTPGEYAPAVNGHKLYLSENFDDVNDCIGGITQSVSSYDPPGRLDFGKTYYWRVDEVNSVSGWDQGNVWQFTIEPFSFPIEDVNATASSSNAVNEGPENTINGSGLDDDDLHSTNSKAMWLSSVVDPNAAWIQYEFDRVYKLYQMLVWNHNTSTEPVIGFGVKEAAIEYSADGASWTKLGTHEFARGSGTAGYAHNTTVDLGGVVAKYVKITANSNWGGFVPQFGLSEVRFFYIPVLAREPDPASGTTDTNVDNVTLSWRAGREAASHEVYFSDSNQAVIDGNAPVVSVSEASYDTGELQLNQNYYWKIVEVNEAETPTTWEGDVLNFTTRESLVVEDFEDYNNFSPDRVFQTWIDGIGFTEPPPGNPGNGTGAALGHDIWSYDSPHYDGDIMETAIVHGGTQSAPLYYDNSIAPFTSEIVRTFDVPQDWTKHGIKTLTLYFYGDPNNVAQQMYVKLNGVKVIYDGEAANITRIPWQAWNIELADFTGVDPAPVAGVGVDLSNVTELSIGLERIGAVGGSGVVYFDDIRLYPYSREFVTPVEPDTAGLVAHYEFEGTANDSSGNGRNGAAIGDPIFVAGKVGQAISLDGIGDYVEITGYKGILGPNAFSITAWIRTTLSEEQQIVYYGTNVNGQRCEFYRLSPLTERQILHGTD